MKQPDRKTPPKISTVEIIDLKEPDHILTGNNFDLYIFKSDARQVLKFDIVIESTAYYDLKPEVRSLLPLMLPLGTEKYTAEELNELIDYYGAFTSYKGVSDRMYISLYTRSSTFKETLPVFLDSVFHPVFDEKEMEKLKNREISNFEINLKKTKTIAGRLFRKNLFGEDHPYGKLVTKEGFESVTREDLFNAYQSVMSDGKITLIGAGDFTDTHLSLLEKSFRNFNNGSFIHKNKYSLKDSSQKIYEEWDEAVQSSLYIGTHIPGPNHPDIHKISFANTLLGGYFGSRLMKNLREVQGFTYGINSILRDLNFDSQIIIVSDILKAEKNRALEEIYGEIKNLAANSPDMTEMELVKNYLLGSFQSDLSSVFSLAEVFSSIHFLGLDFSYYRQWSEAIIDLQPGEVSEVVKKYIKPEEMLEVVVG